MTLKTVAAFMVFPLVSKMVATAKLFKLHRRPSLAGGCLRRLGKLSITLRRLRSASATLTITPACREISHVAQQACRSAPSRHIAASAPSRQLLFFVP